MEIPGLGTLDEELGGHRSESVPVSLLEGEAEFFLEGYESDDHPEDFHAAIKAFLGLGQSALEAASGPVFEYYSDVRAIVDDGAVPHIHRPEDVWRYVTFGCEAVVARDWFGDKQVCVSIGCGCDWEPEHGLQLVFRGGRVVTKIGPYDDHMSNATTERPDLADVVYRSFRRDS
ncbi:hypothetical protein KGQ20_44520 [Catenulispora sp. NF23]|uniref:DUF6985 domain-containing protein n=1 Tax=Catenulispora pinistramenti TaxID=2705254 RepID=UPI001BA75134|nr:hypothetical protein [Catenulispora pinistramenti]MBS2539829.1 hypothetical protein [Catenulispora pinistramenti]